MEHILAILFVIALLGAVYFFFIRLDIQEAKKYRKARKSRGIILKAMGEEKVGFYGEHRKRIYYKYLVRFSSNEGIYEEPFLTKEANLAEGTTVDVRYVMEEGENHIVNPVSYHRVRELTIAAVCAIPFCIVIIYLREKGILPGR